MSPAKVQSTQEPEEQYDYVHIDDFSPGCYNGSHISTEDPVISAPLGAAELDATFCCASIVGGALGPLPGVTVTKPFSTLGGLPGTATTAVMTGFIITPQLLSNWEVVALFEADDGTDHYVRAFSYVPQVPSLHAITGPTESVPTTPGYFGSPYPAFTRMTADGTGNPPPKLVFPTAVVTDSSTTNGHLWVYPEILSPTSYTAQDLIVMGSSITGQVICYGNRVICLAGITYSWPSGGGINTNENINFTDPPQSAEYGDQMTILAAEEPWGYGAWGSVSVGELLLVKKHEGAVILNGDIDDPTSVIPIRGVTSTGDIVGSAAATPTGLIYCAEKQGAWIWNGGNVSQKLSANIRDDFFDLESGVILSNNYGFFVYQWGKWAMFSNNVIYDMANNSWWNLYPPRGTTIGGIVGQEIFWYTDTSFENEIAVSPLVIRANTDPFYTVFDNTSPTTAYQWQSVPIHVVKDADHVLDVREVIVRASTPDGDTHCKVTVTIGSWTGVSTGTIGSNPTMLRFNAAALGLQDIVVKVLAQNTNAHAAPIIHSIDIGWASRAKIATQN